MNEAVHAVWNTVLHMVLVLKRCQCVSVPSSWSAQVEIQVNSIIVILIY